MTGEEALKQLNGLIRCMNLNKMVNVSLYPEDKEAIETVLNLIEKQQAEIDLNNESEIALNNKIMNLEAEK